MSSRQLRRLQKQRELEEVQNVAEQESEESDGALAPVAPKPRVSLFAALGGDGDDDAQDEDEEEEQQPVKDAVEEAQQPPAPGKGKKKKKKKKAKAKAADAAGVEEQDEDEIDKAIKELNITTGSKLDGSDAAAGSGASTRRINELLTINPYHLKAVNEMRNLFGRDVIESAEAEEEQERVNRRRRGPVQREVDLETFLRGPPGAPKLPEVSLRRNIFIQGRDHWPRQSAGGLTMKEIGKAPDGSWTEYAYVHDQNYDAVQTVFFTCVLLGDPMRMVHLLNEAPYHVSTLLQVSSVAKQDQNQSLAAELCERALFTFGRVTTSAFRQNIEQGKARLDFRRPENRQFWLAGYHYLKSLIRKGTYRTSLEWAKLLYTLDTKDPYAMRHFIHFLAIRAHEARWLIDFIDEVEKTSDNRDTVYLRQSLVLAHLQLGDNARATEELENGMRRVPWLYCALFQELGLDTPPSIWGINADSDARSFWVKLYILHTKELWNNSQAMPVLERVAKSLEKVDTGALPSDDPPADQGATRLAYLEGQTSLIALAPRELLDTQPNYEFDPLPPPEEENIFSGEGTRRPWNRRNSDLQAGMRSVLGRNAAAPGQLPRMPMGDFPDDEDDDIDPEVLAEMRHDMWMQQREEMPQELLDEIENPEWMDHSDEDLRESGPDPGLLQRLMGMFGGTEAGPTRDTGGEAGEAARGDRDGEERRPGENEREVERGQGRDNLPGAWPDDER
ncbi:hypothetical protein FZEAL_7758 [Fusarium zealandicum]|uniref:Ribosome quality control complex subunit 1 n=1 Tax=Fusarium zealandicum TaxID=1053134 RepID=A0A8H4XI63_9HYPO|nr:hypothetical protein FZEAL_7758 [Fusarium zealandicum]